MVKRISTVGLVIALFLSSSFGWARSPSLDRGLRELNHLAYRPARTALIAALAEGHNELADLKLVYTKLGEINAILGKEEDSVNAFVRLLLLEPRFELAPGTSPRVAHPFVKARSVAKANGALETHLEYDGVDLELHLDNNPLGIARWVRFTVTARGTTEPVISTQEPTQGLAQVRIQQLDSVRVSVLDNVMNELQVFEPPLDILRPTAIVPQPALSARKSSDGAAPARESELPRARPFLLRWTPWVVMAAGAAAGGTYFGFRARAARDALVRLAESSEQANPAQIRDTYESGKQAALFANVGFAAAAAFATGAVVVSLIPEGQQKHTEAGVATRKRLEVGFRPQLSGFETRIQGEF